MEPPELKKDEMDARRERREQAEADWKAALAVGDFATAHKLAQRCVKYTPEMVEESIEMLTPMGIMPLERKLKARLKQR